MGQKSSVSLFLQKANNNPTTIRKKFRVTAASRKFLNNFEVSHPEIEDMLGKSKIFVRADGKTRCVYVFVEKK